MPQNSAESPGAITSGSFLFFAASNSARVGFLDTRLLRLGEPVHPRDEYGLQAAIVVGQDTRRSGDMFVAAIAAGATSLGVSVHVVGVVPTPGVVHHGLDRNVPDELIEPVEVMVEAAKVLCTGDPASLTGQVAYSRALLEERGLNVPAARGKA